MFYGPSIMKDAGFAGESINDLLYSMIFLCIVNTIGNFIGLSMSSKYGRKELILKCTRLMGFSLLVMAAAMIANSISTSTCNLLSLLTY